MEGSGDKKPIADSMEEDDDPEGDEMEDVEGGSGNARRPEEGSGRGEGGRQAGREAARQAGRQGGRLAGGSLVQLFSTGVKRKRGCVVLRMGGRRGEDTPCESETSKFTPKFHCKQRVALSCGSHGEVRRSFFSEIVLWVAVGVGGSCAPGELEPRLSASVPPLIPRFHTKH